MLTLHDAQQSHNQLGALPPEIILKSLNTGLTASHLDLDNSFAYTFSKALVADLKEVFEQQQAHGLFLCEMGSQKPDHNIDGHFKLRCAATANGTYKTPNKHLDVALVDSSNTAISPRSFERREA